MIGLVLVLLLGTGPDRDRDRAEAEVHARKAEALVAHGQYDAAERELHSAYALDSSPYHLFGLGMVAKLRGDCDRALGFFDRVLEALPTSDLDDAARQGTETAALEQIAACGGRPPDEPTPAPPTSPPLEPRIGATPAPAPSPTPPPRVARPWHRDPTAGVLMGLGSTAVATGLGLVIGGAVVDRNAQDAGTATGFLEAGERARRLAVAGVVVSAIGTSLVIGAITRWIVVKRRGDAVTRTARLARRMRAASSRCCSR